MAGTIAGGKAAAETNKRRDPDFYRKIGLKSRENWRKTPIEQRKPWGFRAMTQAQVREAGRKGGTISRRG